MLGTYRLNNGEQVAVLDADCDFPPVDHATRDPNGLVAIGGELTAASLLAAYRQGIFPWFNADEPLLWWSPNPRMVLFPDELKISRSLQKRLKKPDYQVKFNHNFSAVMQACAAPRQGQQGTWITPEMLEAYCALHRAGHAISAETWINGQLVGGCYGVIIGQMFYGESMFHHVTDASKIAFVHLVRQLKHCGVTMLDCQMKTPHLASLGAREITRAAFIKQLGTLVSANTPRFDNAASLVESISPL